MANGQSHGNGHKDNIMAGIQILDANGVPFKADGDRFNAIRVNARPLDYGDNGAYGVTGVSGTMAAGLAANSEIYQFRWGDATKRCVVQEILFEGAGWLTAGAAGVSRIECLVARGWTASGTGGTALGTALLSNGGKLQTDMAASLIGTNGDARIASTAALGVGTKTLDSNGIGAVVTGVVAAVGTTIVPNNALFQPDQLHPLVLEQNEGFVIRATVPGTGTWIFGITVRWTELDVYE